MPVKRPQKRMPVEKEMQTQIKNIRFDKEWDLDIHESSVGNIYSGKLYFNGKGKKVVIKEIPLKKRNKIILGKKIEFLQTLFQREFSKRGLKYTAENLANLYSKTIIELRNLGIPLPKMKAIVWQGKLLLISQYFGNSERRKLSKYFRLQEMTDNELNEFLDLVAKTLDSGYVPTYDFIEQFRGKEKGYVPLDIDLLIFYRLHLGTDPKKMVETTIRKLISKFTIRNYNQFKKEMSLLISKIKNESIKKELEKQIEDYLRKNFILPS